MRPVATAAAAVIVLTACAPALPGYRTPAPEDIPRLEAAVARDSSDVGALVALGVAYRAAGRRDDALARLERAVVLQPAEPSATVFLGLTYEDAGDPTRARELYQRYLEVGSSEAVKRQLRQRVDLLSRQELVARARQLVRDDAAGVTAAPEPGTVAIFPFLYVGTDPQYQPLERALAEMLVTDLSQTSRLTVLERLRVQALLTELQLSQTDRVDPATAVRSGRMLRAERVVQGSITIEPSALRLGAAIVGATGQASQTTPVTEDDVRRLFDAEKQLALSLYQSLGVELTVAERERVEQRPTTNIQALLAYGEGLEAEDRGDFAAAAGHHARAAQLDPGFTLAAERGARTTAIGEAQTAGVAGIAEDAAAELQGEAGAVTTLAPPTPPSLDAVSDLTADPMGRDAAAEVMGVEGIALRTMLRIVFRRP